MPTTESRLQALETLYRTREGELMGWLTLEPGQRPIDALEGQKPGLWFIIDAGLNGPGYMGSVSNAGKRTIVYGETDHVND